MADQPAPVILRMGRRRSATRVRFDRRARSRSSRALAVAIALGDALLRPARARGADPANLAAPRGTRRRPRSDRRERVLVLHACADRGRSRAPAPRAGGRRHAPGDRPRGLTRRRARHRESGGEDLGRIDNRIQLADIATDRARADRRPGSAGALTSFGFGLADLLDPGGGHRRPRLSRSGSACRCVVVVGERPERLSARTPIRSAAGCRGSSSASLRGSCPSSFHRPLGWLIAAAFAVPALIVGPRVASIGGLLTGSGAIWLVLLGRVGLDVSRPGRRRSAARRRASSRGWRPAGCSWPSGWRSPSSPFCAPADRPRSVPAQDRRSSSSRRAPRISSSRRRSFGRPAARFIAMRSSRLATRSGTPCTVAAKACSDKHLVVESRIRIREQIEVAEPRRQREEPAGSEGASVEGWHRRRIRRQAPPSCRDVAQDAGDRAEVGGIPRVTDVQIVGHRWGAVSLGGQSADHHEPDAGGHEPLQDRCRIEASLFAHSATRLKSRQNSTMFRSFSIPARGARMA